MNATYLDIVMIVFFIVLFIGAMIKGEWFLAQTKTFKLVTALSTFATFLAWILSKHL